MAFAQRTDNGPGTGSELLDVSASDRTWDPKSQRCPRKLYVVGAGDVAFTGLDGVSDTWTVAAKTYIDVAMQAVLHTGTTATGIHAIY